MPLIKEVRATHGTQTEIWPLACEASSSVIRIDRGIALRKSKRGLAVAEKLGCHRHAGMRALL